MEHFFIITNAAGESTKVPISEIGDHPMQPGDNVSVTDADGNPVDVNLRPDGEDLKVSFGDEEGTEAVLKNFYSDESNPVTVSLKPVNEEATSRSSHDFDTQVGNLPDSLEFSLMQSGGVTQTPIVRDIRSGGIGGGSGVSPAAATGGSGSGGGGGGGGGGGDAPNVLPVAVDDAAGNVQTGSAILIDVLANDTDGDVDDLLTIVGVDQPTRGSVSVSADNQLLFDPGSDFDALGAGDSEEVVFNYLISDGEGGTDTATVTLVVRGVDDPTITESDAAETDEETAVDVDVLANDSDADASDSPLQVASVDVSSLTGGQVSIAANGSGVSFDPNDDFEHLGAGESEIVTFSYTTSTGVTETVTLTVTGVNDGPVAVDNDATLDEDSMVNIDVLANDTDVDANDTKVILSINGLPAGGLVTLASGATVRVKADGTLDYDTNGQFDYLDDGESTTDTFSYVVSDGKGGSDTAEVTVTINGTEDATVVVADEVSTDEGTAVVIDALANDSDVDTSDNPLTITSVDDTSLMGGVVTIAGDGSSVSFDPNGDFEDLAVGESTTVSFTYTTNTGASETVTVTVIGTNDDPIAVDDNTAVGEDATINIDVLANDTDVDTSDGKTVVSVNGLPSGGLITLASGATIRMKADGTFDYNTNGQFDYLDDGETAIDTFSYVVSDGNGGTDTAQVTITVNGSDDATVTVEDAATTDEGSAIVVDVLANDSDVDTSDNPLTITSVSTVASGTVAIAPDASSVTFDPNGDFEYLAVGESATVTFTYTTNTGVTESVTVTVTGTNDGPVAVDDTSAVSEDATINIDVLGNDTDLDTSDGQTIISINGLPAGGLITLASGATVRLKADGTLDYDPNGQFEGLDAGESAIDTFTYVVSDGNGGSDTAQVTVTINGEEDATVTVEDAATTDEGSAIVIDVLANDSDVDTSDNPLTITSVSTVASGTVAIAPDASSVTFDPNGDFEYLAVGESATVTFTYTTNTGVTESVTVTVTGTNDGPVAVDDTSAVSENATINIDVLGNDTDLDTSDGQTIISINGLPAGGLITLASGATVRLKADGTLDYDPNGQFEGLDASETAIDTFTYVVSDGNGGSDTAQVTVTINGEEDATVTVEDAATTDEGSAIVIDVLANDSDVDTSDNPLTITSVSTVASGTVAIAPDASSVTFDPNGDFEYLAVGESATVTFTYTTNTGVTESVTVTVTGTNDGPVAVDDTSAVSEDATINIDVLGNDTDLDTSDGQTIISINGLPAGGLITLASGATVRLKADGTLDYDPNGQFEHLDASETAIDTFTYVVSDGNGGSDTAQVTVTINGEEDATVTVEDAATTDEGTAVVIDALANDSDVDTSDNPLTITAFDATGIPGGVVTVAPDGSSVSFDPNGDFEDLAVGESEVVTFTYTTSTGATESVTVTVTGTNDGPVAVDDTASVNEGAMVNIDVLGNDTDVDASDGQTITSINGLSAGGLITLASGATVRLKADGTLDYDSNDQFEHLAGGESATDTFSYVVSDGNGGSATAQVTVTINGADDPTVTVTDTAETNEETSVAIDVLANDSDADASDNPLTIMSVDTSGLAGGVVTVAPDNLSLSFDPSGGFEYLGVGESEAVSFTYTTSTNATETVTVIVTGTNDGPVAVDDAASVGEDATVNIDVLANDTDADINDGKSIISINGLPAGGIVTLLSGATVRLQADGTIDYDPGSAYQSLNAGQSATETFTYVVTDGNGGSDVGTVTVTINGSDDATTIVADTATTDENTNVTIDLLANDSDVDDALLIQSVDTAGIPAGTSVMVSGDSQSVDFNVGTAFDHLAAGESATVTFTYTTNTGVSETATVTVTGSNDGPVSTAVSESVTEDTIVEIDLLANVSDVDTTDVLSVTTINGLPAFGSIILPSGATLRVKAGGVVDYDPGDVFDGLDETQTATDTFTFLVSDGNGGSVSETVTVTISGTDDPTVTVADTGTLEENGTAIDIDVIANDSDVDASDSDLTIASIVAPAKGVATVSPDNKSINFDANGEFESLGVGESEAVTFTYTTNTGATENVTVIVTGTNDAPVAVADSGSVDEDMTVNIDLLGDDTDADANDTVSVISINGFPAGGLITLLSGATVRLNADGTVTYDPAGQFDSLSGSETATDTFNYVISDGKGGSSSAAVTVTVNGVDDPTVTVEDHASTSENVDVTIAALANDSDVDNALTIASLDTSGLPSGASATISGDSQSVNFTVGTGFDYLASGETTVVTFTYTTNTGSTENINVTVTGTNDAPVAIAKSAPVSEDAVVEIDLLNGDTDLDTSDTLTLSRINGLPAFGTITLASGANVTIKADGKVDYDPGDIFDYLDDGESATDTFTYVVSDGRGGSDTETVTVTINGSDDATVTVADTATVGEDGPSVSISVLDNDSDIEPGDDAALAITQLTIPGGATVAPNAEADHPDGGKVTLSADGLSAGFDPDGDYDHLAAGQTQVVTFTYTTNTGATETVSVTVVGSNDGPTAVADTATVGEDATTDFNLLTGDTDPDTGDTLTVSRINGIAAGGVLTLVSGATVTVLGDGNVRYNPGDHFDDLNMGETATDTFNYTIQDNNGASSTATVTITINGADDASVLTDDEATTSAINDVVIDVLANDVDVDDTLTVASVDGSSLPGDATVSVSNGGANVTFDPGTAFASLGVGETQVVTFQYTTNTGETANASVTVTGINDAPVAVDDTGSVAENGSVTIGLLDNDTDVDVNDTKTITSINGFPAFGTITLTSGATLMLDASGNATYSPGNIYDSLDETETATDTFTYVVSDGKGGSSSATVTITINGEDDPIVIVADSDSTDEDTAVTIDVLANDSDLDDTLIVSAVDATASYTDGNGDPATGGTITIAGDSKSISFDPGSDFNSLAVGETQIVTFTYSVKAEDAAGDPMAPTVTETVTVTITGTNDAPIAQSSTETTDEDVALTSINVLGNDSDPDGDLITVVAASASNGAVTVNGDGTLSYVPNANFNGVDTITYVIRDLNGATATSTVGITINPVNDAPVVTNEMATINEDETLANFNVLMNDSDPENDAISILGTPIASNGMVVVNGDNTITYTPNPNYSGVDTIIYTVQDVHGATSTAEVRVTVTPVNDAPGALPTSGVVTEDVISIATGNLSAPDVEGHTVTFTAVTDAAGSGGYGGFTVQANGVWNYSLDNASAAVQGLKQGETLIDTYTYTATDSQGASSQETISVTISGTNDDPTDLDITNLTIDENIMFNIATGMGEQAGATVGLLSTTDADNGDTFTYEVIEDDPTQYNWFEIGGANGDELVVKADTDLNHEVRENHQVKIRVTDSEGATYIETFTVSVNDVNEAPENFIVALQGDISASATVSTMSASGLTASTSVASVFTGSFVYHLSTSFDDAFNSGEGNFLTGHRIHRTGGNLGSFDVSTSEIPLGQGADVASLTDGTLIVAYAAVNGDGSGSGIMIRQFSTGFAGALSAEINVNTGLTAGDQIDAHVTALDDGGFVVVWTDVDTDTVYTQKYDSSLSTVGGPTAIIGASEVDVVATSGGEFLVSWTEGTEGSREVHSQRYLADGSKNGASVALHGATPGDNVGSEIVEMTDGSLMVVWAVDNGDGTYSIMRTFLNGDGTQNGSAIDTLHTNSSGEGEIGGLALEPVPNGDAFGIFFHQIDPSDGTGSVFSWVFNNLGNPITPAPTVISQNSDARNPVVNTTTQGNFDVAWDANVDGGGSIRGVEWNIVNRDTGVFGNPRDEETRVTSGGYQPEVVGLQDGGYVVFSRTMNLDGDGWGIQAQRYDSSGMAMGTAYTVNEATAGDQEVPMAVTLNDQGYVLVFESNGNVMLQRYSADNQPLGGNVTVNTGAADASSPSIVALSDGGYALTWVSEAQGIVTQEFDSDGLVVGTNEVINQTAVATENVVSSAGLTGDGYVAVWTDASGEFIGRVVGTGGVTNEFTVNTTTAGEQTNPVVAGLENGGWIIVWESEGQDGDLGGIYGQLYAANGLPQGGEFLVNTTTTGNQQQPEVIRMQDGGFIVVWQSDHQVDHEPEIWYQRYNADGTPNGGEVLVGENPDTATNTGVGIDASSYPAAVQLNTGDIIFVWSYETGDGVGEGVRIRRFEQGPDESAAGPLLVAVLGNDDVDADDTHTYTLVTGGDKFEIIGNQIWLKAGESLVNLTAESQDFTVRVRLTDQGGNSIEEDLTLTFFGGLDAPTNITFDDGDAGTDDDTDIGTVDGAAGGTVLATLAAVDVDTDDSFMFEVVPDPNEFDIFEVVGNELRVKAGFELEAAARSVHNITIRVEDSRGATYDEVVTITVSAVNDAPTHIDISPFGDFVGLSEGFGNGGDGNFPNSGVSVVALAGGGYELFYTSELPNGNNGTYAETYDASSTLVGSRRLIGDESTVNHKAAVEIETGGTQYGVLFTNSRTLEGTIRVFDSSYNTELANLTLNAGATSYGGIVPIGTAGRFAVSWQEGNNNFFQILEFDGTSAVSSLTSATRTNQNTTGSQGVDSSIALLEDGSFLTLWVSANQDGSGNGVYGRRYDAGGNAVGGEFLVNEGTTGDQSGVEVVQLTGGHTVVVWQSDNAVGGGDGTDVVAKIYGIDGGGNLQVEATEFVVHSGATNGNQEEPQVIALANGGFAVAWFSDDGSSTVVKLQEFMADGTAVGSAIDVDTSAGDKSDINLDQLADGTLVVVWDNSVGLGNGRATVDLTTSAVTTHTGVFSETTLDLYSDLVALSNGNFLVVQENLAYVVDADGNVVVSEFVYPSGGNNFQDTDAAVLADGSVLITSRTNGLPGGENFDIILTRLTPEGEVNTISTIVNPTVTANQGNPSVVATDDGGYAVFWDSNNIRGQIFDTEGRAVGGELTLTAPNGFSETDPVGVALDGGGFIVAYRDAAGGTRLRLVRLDAAGNEVVGPTQINVTDAGATQQSLEAVKLSNGHVVFVWEDVNAGADGESTAPGFATGSVIGRIYDPGTDTFLTPTDFVIPTDPDGRQQNHDVVALNNGGFMVVWEHRLDDVDTFEVRAQQFDNSGARVGVEFVVAEGTGSSFDPNVAQNADGVVLFTYSDNGTDGTRNTVQVRAFQIEGVSETIAAGSAVALLSAVNEEESDVLTFSLLDGVGGNIIANDGMFEVVGTELRLLAGQSLDYETATSHSVAIRVDDGAGNIYDQVVTFQVVDDGLPPVVIDLDGDGVEFDSVSQGILTDVDGDGQLEQTAWADEDDAVLVYDANDNNDVDGRSEYAFADYGEEGATDLEGLRHFDSNGDLVLDANDDEFHRFKLWQDVDGDGKVGENEMFTLTDAGIESIELQSDGESYSAAGGNVFVHGEATVNFTDGSKGTAADASFEFSELADDDDSLEIVSSDGRVVDVNASDAADDVPASADILAGQGEAVGAPGDDLMEGGAAPATSIEDDAAANAAAMG